MHNISIPQVKFSADIPSCIEDLSPVQYILFARIIKSMQDGFIKWEEARIQLLKSFLRLKSPFRKLRPQEKDVIFTEIYRISEVLDSFKKDDVINLDFTKNPLPWCHNFRGPDDALTNLTFQQFIDAYMSFLKFDEQGFDDDLDRLFAALYRYNNPVFMGLKNKYPEYSEREFNLSLKHAREITMDEKWAVMLWFRGCLSFLHSGDIQVGGNTINLGALYSSSSEGSRDDTGLIGVMYTIAESGVFGPVDKVATTNLYDILVRIYQVIQLSKSLKA